MELSELLMYGLGFLMCLVFLLSAIACFMQAWHTISLAGILLYFIVGAVFTAITILTVAFLIATYVYEKME